MFFVANRLCVTIFYTERAYCIRRTAINTLIDVIHIIVVPRRRILLLEV